MALFPSHLRDLARRIERDYAADAVDLRRMHIQLACEACDLPTGATETLMSRICDTGEASDLTAYDWGLIAESLKIAAAVREAEIELNNVMA